MSEIVPKPNSQKVLLAIIAVLVTVLILMVTAGFRGSQVGTKPFSAQEQGWLKGKGAFFVRKNCTSCHSIEAFGIQSAHLGPDLSTAVVDTERRFGKSLEEFLRNPNGTMSIVLSSRIPLTEAERREAIGLLKIAYQLKLEQAGKLGQQAPPIN